jgi:hypothetical protein
MQNASKIQAMAANLSYPEAVVWIEDHPHEYQKDIFRGLVAAK